MAAKQLTDISFALVRGEAPETLLSQCQALNGQLDAEGLLAAFKVLPRSLTYPSIDKFFSAELQVKSFEVSAALVTSQFVGCEPATNDKYFSTVATAVSRAAADTSLSATLYKWRVAVCSRRPAVADVETHAVAAISYALATPQCVTVESLADATKDLKFATAEGKALSALLVAILDGNGIAALPAALPTLQQLNIAPAASRKVRLLDLSAYCMNRREASYDELKARLQVADDEEIETLVVDAATAGILDAKVNKNDKKISIHAVVPLRFTKDAWVNVRGQAASMAAFVDQLLAAYQSRP